MRIVIPDDYQDIVHRLKCFELLRGHEVLRFREPARDMDELAERLADAQVVVAIRERVHFPRSLLERLPKLELLALVGRHSKVIDFAACRDLGIDVVQGSSASPASPAELTMALILASQHLHRGGTHEARRAARRPRAPAAREHARRLRTRDHRSSGG
jgi:D-3-phosphoglycerate dehydrogenase